MGATSFVVFNGMKPVQWDGDKCRHAQVETVRSPTNHDETQAIVCILHLHGHH